MTYSAMVSKHGETGVFAILENWERSIGLRYNEPVSLEHRWNVFMDITDTTTAMAA